MAELDGHDRSRFRRVRANILVRPAGLFDQRAPREVDEHQVGGLRAYTDERQKPGKRLELEILLPDQGSVTLLAEVAWVEALPPTAPARYDVGLCYVRISREDLKQIEKLLEPTDAEPNAPAT